MTAVEIERRAAVHAALGDPTRLAVVDELCWSDRSPGELSRSLGLAPSLLAFHLDTLERSGVVRRVTSSGDRRRRYVQLVPAVLDLVAAPSTPPGRPVVFVCTRNSARSQLAAAAWRAEFGAATSAGTDPAPRVHAGAIAAARRAGLDLGDATPHPLPDDLNDRCVVTVCDRAREELSSPDWHWSIPDPVDDGTDAAFDRALDLIRTRIAAFAPAPSHSATDSPTAPTEAP